MEETKILIIEDEQKIADTLKVGLIENGYYVEVAYDGKIGERLFFAHDFNLVILDINLPKLADLRSYFTSGVYSGHKTIYNCVLLGMKKNGLTVAGILLAVGAINRSALFIRKK